MRFTVVAAAFAALAGVVSGQSMTAKPASSAPSATTSFSSITHLNPLVNNLCISYALAIPTCGTTALLSLASKMGGCGMVDFACQCHYSAAVQAVASSPIIANCGLDTALIVQGAANQLCQCVSANDAPVATNGSLAKATGAAAPGYGHAAPTGLMGVMFSLGGALAAGAGIVAAL